MEISTNICKIAEFKDAIYFDASCSCQSNDHIQTLIVGVDEELRDITLQIYSKVLTPMMTSSDSRFELWEAMQEADYFKIAFYKAKLIAEHFLSRVKFTFNIWTKGRIEVENEFIFRNEKAIDDYIFALTSAKEQLKKELKNGTNPER
jgi:hypothetical protein